jgi:hypothetical protein
MSAIEELAALEAQEAEEARAAKQGAAETAATIELENRKIIRELKTRITVPILRIDTDAGMVVVKRVSRLQYDHYFGMLLDEEQRANAYRVLTAAAVVHPDPDRWESMCEAFPALCNSIGVKTAEFCGGKSKEKKL